MKSALNLLTSIVLLAPLAARPMEIEDLFRLQRISDPQLSPEGKWLVYVVGSPNLEKNTFSSALWLTSAQGGKPRPLTTANKKDRHPRWSPDGKQILFESNRSGKVQLWLIPIDGGEARQLTNLSTGAFNGLWSPDGKWIAFVSSVLPQFSDKPFRESDALNKKTLEEKEKNPVKARVFTRLFFRHWDSHVEDQRQHLFIIPATGGEPRDLTPGDRDGYPNSTTFSVGDDFTFSPDSSQVIFTAPPKEHEAWNTNYDI